MANTYATEYEWVLEILEEGEVVDVQHEDKLADLEIPSDGEWVIALVRTSQLHDNHVSDKYWAYVVDGVLPEYFEDSSIKVPQKYRKEFQLTNSRNLL